MHVDTFLIKRKRLIKFTCMKKLTKKPGKIVSHKINFTIDEKLNELNVEALAPKKIAEANRHLKRMKSLPK